MTERDQIPPFLYVVVCAAGIAAGVGKLITAAQEREWHVGVIATPTAMNGFFDTAAVVVAPATFNTINKWAAGIADTLAVGTLCEVVGRGVPVGVLTCVSDDLARHPAYQDSLIRLRGMGVRFGYPYQGAEGEEFEWERALDLVEPQGR
ncbi:flavoprotein [Streptomyces canus]|uniref:flavoprotein n=1 Tax=Streptomyces canus TaxID=58343 RepID=UPI00037BC7C1|nr:flavoprotein [Streptomyces canus]